MGLRRDVRRLKGDISLLLSRVERLGLVLEMLPSQLAEVFRAVLHEPVGIVVHPGVPTDRSPVTDSVKEEGSVQSPPPPS